MALTHVTFNNGQKFPIFGLGTWQSREDDLKTALRAALDTGYRHIDTATAYQNEAVIGEVLQEYFKAGKLKREDVFITTKLFPTFMREDLVPKSLDKSLEALKLDYVDLYLVHWPIALKDTGRYYESYPINEDGSPALDDTDHLSTWRGMEAVARAGKAKSIGVSNLNKRQVQRIMDNCSIKPAVNQLECHAYLSQRKLQEFMSKWGIVITSYGSLGSPGRPEPFKKQEEPVLMQDPLVLELSQKYKKTPGQILLRYLIQRNIMVIPKSSNPSRIKENFQVFDFSISDADQERLLALDRGYHYFNPFQNMDHPENPFNEEF